MPGTMRGKQEPPSAEKDAVSTPPSTGKVDLKNKLTGAGKGADTTRSLPEKAAKSVDASKATGTSTPTSSARQRARDRRRGRVEVSPEPDSNSPDPEASAGRIKGLAGFWSTPKDEVQVVRKKRLEVAERTEKADSETDSSDSDSDSDGGLKRAQEAPPAAETIEIEKGRAKSIANMWQNRKEEDVPAKRMPFKLDIQTEEPTVFENEPVVLEGVVRSEDRAVRDDIVIGRPGRIKDLAVNFANNSQTRPESSDDDDESAEKQSSTAAKTKEEVIESGKIRNVRERWKKRQQKSKASDSDSDGDESSAAEDAPPSQRSSRNKDQVIEQAKIRNLRERWSRQDGFGGREAAIDSKRQAPNRLHSLVTATEYGVFENEPTVREDVVRADDEQPDIISCDKTQKMRRMWTMMDKEVMKDKEPLEKVVKPAKKKEDKRDAEPEVAKPQTTKPLKAIGRLHGVKDESPKPKEEGKHRKGHRSSHKEAESEKVTPKDQKQQQQEPEGKGKLQRAFTIAAVGDNKPAAPKSPSLTRYASRKKVA